jgi:Uma2 family endonuclease
LDTEVNEAARKYTYEDYLNRDDDIRFELIDGVIYMLATPVQVHQEIAGEIHGQLWSFLKGKPCKVFMAPFGVRLNADSGDNTILEPDLFVVCDLKKLDGKSCVGAPDLVVEVLSP